MLYLFIICIKSSEYLLEIECQREFYSIFYFLMKFVSTKKETKFGIKVNVCDIIRAKIMYGQHQIQKNTKNIFYET